MAEPFKTLIYVNRLTQNEKAAAFTCNDAFPFSGLKSSLLKAVEDVCIDRLIRAEGSLILARKMNAVNEETQRAAIGRAY